MSNLPCENTDREIWRERTGDYYADSIHVTEHGGIGINAGGTVIVATLQKWHAAGEMFLCVLPNLPRWKQRLVKRLIGKPHLSPKE